MQVRVLYFAVVRERLGRGHDDLNLSDGATLETLWRTLCERHPVLDGLRRHLRFSVNLEFVNDDVVLADGDEVALIPPVAGGIDGSVEELLQEGPLDVERIKARVARPEAGALITFEGIVRNHSKGQAVEYLEYEVYPAMAVARLQQVIDEVERDWPEVRCALCHRFGRLDVGDAAVVIAVSSAHREPAFAACARAIARIKEIVPIWKREVSPDGSHWVGMGS